MPRLSSSFGGEGQSRYTSRRGTIEPRYTSRRGTIAPRLECGKFWILRGVLNIFIKVWNKLFFIIYYLIIILILDINLIKTEIIIKKIIIQSLSDKKVFQSIINIFFCNKWMFSISRGRVLLKIIASGRLLKIPSLLIMNPDWLPQAPSKYNSHRRAIVPLLDCT